MPITSSCPSWPIEHDRVSLAGVANRLEVDLGHQRAGGVDRSQPPLVGHAADFGRHAVRRVEQRAPPRALRPNRRRTRPPRRESVRRRTCCGRSRDRRRSACRKRLIASSRLSIAMLTPAQKPRGAGQDDLAWFASLWKPYHNGCPPRPIRRRSCALPALVIGMTSELAACAAMSAHRHPSPPMTNRMTTAAFTVDLAIVRARGRCRRTAVAGRSRAYCRQLARHALREFSPSPVCCLPRRCDRIFTRLRLLPLGRRSGRRDGRSAAQPRLARLVGGRAASCYAGQRAASGVRRTARDDRRIRDSARAVSPICSSPFARTSSRTLRNVRRPAGLLPLLGQSRRPAGALPGPLASTSSAARLSDSICTGLQLANFCQDVAGDWRPWRHLFAAGRLPPTSATTKRDFASRQVQRGFRRLMALRGRSGRNVPSRRTAAGRAGAARRSRSTCGCSPTGAGDPRADHAMDYDVWQRRPKCLAPTGEATAAALAGLPAGACLHRGRA